MSDPASAAKAVVQQVKPTRARRSPEALFDPVQGQLLRACRPAVRRLARAARGRSDFHSELEVRACLGLARIAADLLYGRMKRPVPPDPRDPAAAETRRLIKRYFGDGGEL